ncbi:MAG: hypothetical protein IPG50_22440 [Myxococcales bacterium]|nr:hypothetical protein [Myxococcales bacterium]
MFRNVLWLIAFVVGMLGVSRSATTSRLAITVAEAGSRAVVSQAAARPTAGQPSQRGTLRHAHHDAGCDQTGEVEADDLGEVDDADPFGPANGVDDEDAEDAMVATCRLDLSRLRTETRPQPCSLVAARPGSRDVDIPPPRSA